MSDYVWRRIGLNSGIFASELGVNEYQLLEIMDKGLQTRLLAARVAIADSLGRQAGINVKVTEMLVIGYGNNNDMSLKI